VRAPAAAECGPTCDGPGRPFRSTDGGQPGTYGPLSREFVVVAFRLVGRPRCEPPKSDSSCCIGSCRKAGENLLLVRSSHKCRRGLRAKPIRSRDWDPPKTGGVLIWRTASKCLTRGRAKRGPGSFWNLR
jgi:hypothetical protein